MSYQTIQYRGARDQRKLRPIFGAFAAIAAVATLSLAVLAPMQAGRDGAPLRSAAPVTDIARAPAEVAIMPGRIDVVAVRARSDVRAGEIGPANGRQRT
jgi:hypothetical protein